MKKVIKLSKALLFLAVCLLVVSCGRESCKNEKTRMIPRNIPRNIEVIIIDSCEYISMDNGYKGGCSIVHKNNCKFCAKK